MASYNFTTLFTDCETLLQGDSTTPLATLSEKEVVGLYFSAHWCPPCRGFTPKLADAYKEL
jgi:nucleoredoxin